MPIFINTAAKPDDDPLVKLAAGTIKAETECSWLVSDGHTLHHLPKQVYRQLEEKEALPILEKMQLEKQIEFAKELEEDEAA